MKARKIELKTLNFLDAAGSTQQFPYRDGLLTVITASGQGGLSTDDVLKAVDIKIELSKADGALHLQESDYNWLLGKLNNTIRWSVANESIAEFIKDVRGAPLVDLTEPEVT